MPVDPRIQKLIDGPILNPIGHDRARTPGGKSGHHMPPGTGPEGETCGTCRHLFRNRMSKVYLKCLREEHRWTGGAKTDVRKRDAACGGWEKAE